MTRDVRTLTAKEARAMAKADVSRRLLEAFRLAVDAEIYAAAMCGHTFISTNFDGLDKNEKAVIAAGKTVIRELRKRGYQVKTFCGYDLNIDWSKR